VAPGPLKQPVSSRDEAANAAAMAAAVDRRIFTTADYRS